jgi:hypothetical protein
VGRCNRMKPWQQWLGTRIAELKSTNPDITYERIGQWIREELRNQTDLDLTLREVLNKLEGQIPGKLGTFVGKVYRTHLKTKSE